MHILYVSQYFPPEMGAPSARVYELAREWVALDHRVTVLTAFPHHPTGVKSPADRRRITRRETKDGIEVVRAYVYATPNKGIAKRMLSYGSFMAAAAVIGPARVRRPDVVIATSPQLLCACAGYLLAKWFRVPFIFEVRDLWPESILAVEAMRENSLVRSLKRVAAFLYRNSDTIVTVGEGYKRKIHELYGIPNEKMRVVPNGIHAGLFVPSDRDNEIRRDYGWGQKKVVLYLGTHGMAHALHVVLESARMLRDKDEFLFVFVGEGAEKDKLKDLAAEWALPNVQFIDQQPKEKVVRFYAACDLGLVTLRDTPLFQEVLPSKIFEYMAMRRPVLISVGGEARRLVESSGGGAYVPPEDAAALAGAIVDTTRDREKLHKMGAAGRQFVLERFDRSVQARRYLGLLESIRASDSFSGKRHGGAGATASAPDP